MHRYRFPVNPAGLKFPLENGLDGFFVESKTKTACNAVYLHGAIFADDRIENNGALKARLTSFFGVFRENLFYKNRVLQRSFDAELSAAKVSSLAFSSAGAITGANAMAIARSYAVAVAWAG